MSAFSSRVSLTPCALSVRLTTSLMAERASTPVRMVSLPPVEPAQNQGITGHPNAGVPVDIRSGAAHTNVFKPIPDSRQAPPPSARRSGLTRLVEDSLSPPVRSECRLAHAAPSDAAAPVSLTGCACHPVMWAYHLRLLAETPAAIRCSSSSASPYRTVGYRVPTNALLLWTQKSVALLMRRHLRRPETFILDHFVPLVALSRFSALKVL